MASPRPPSRKSGKIRPSDAPSFAVESSRIPRPMSQASSPQRRQSRTSSDAADFAADLAESRVAQGSPSPAPRPSCRDSASSNCIPLSNMLSHKATDLGHLDNSRPANTLSYQDSLGSSSRPGNESDSEFHGKLKQLEDESRPIESMKDHGNGHSTKSKSGGNQMASGLMPARSADKTTVTGRADGKHSGLSWKDFAATGSCPPDWLSRFTSERCPPSSYPSRRDKTNGSLRLENDSANARRKSPSQSLVGPEEGSPCTTTRPATVTPLESSEKSPLWQADEEFTARDVQFSNSPPVKLGRANSKLDHLCRLENTMAHKRPITNDRFEPRRTNTKINDIAKRERESVRKYPIPRIEEPGVDLISEQPTSAERKHSFSFPRQREMDQQSHHAGGIDNTAKNYLDTTPREDIREGPTSPSAPLEVKGRISPEWSRKPDLHASLEWKPQSTEKRDTGDLEGEKIPGMPVTIYRKASSSQPINGLSEPMMRNGTSSTDPGESLSSAGKDSCDLRRLARASSKSPSPSLTRDKVADQSQQDRDEALSGTGERVTSDESFFRENDGMPFGEVKPLPIRAVGLAGFSRSNSTKSMLSTQSKASADPTARIEAEMNLFAPLDNMSERGSTRNLSLQPETKSESDHHYENEKADETPKPQKLEPLQFPTPHATDAHVDTPATATVEHPDIKGNAATSTEDLFPQDLFPPKKKHEIQHRDSSISLRSRMCDGPFGNVRSNSTSKVRRSKPRPRKRSLLKNSVKPPTVEEDLQQIRIKNNIDDSTLEELADFLARSKEDDEVEQCPEDSLAGSGDLNELPFDVDRFEHMGRSLKTGLAGIRQAKKGIELLEDQVSHSERHPGSTEKRSLDRHSAATIQQNHTAYDPHCPQLLGSPQGSKLVYVRAPFPKLFRSEPKLKPTTLGVLVLLLSFWYLLEYAFHERWGRQYVCYRNSPCKWDPDQPDWGCTLPVKLDEWLTGGTIRPKAAHLLEEVSDLYADAEDWWSGTDIRDIDLSTIRVAGRREQYLRRMDKKRLWPDWNPDPAFLSVIEALAEESLEASGDEHYGIHHDSQYESMADNAVVSWRVRTPNPKGFGAEQAGEG